MVVSHPNPSIQIHQVYLPPSKKMAFKKMDVPTSKAFSSAEACSGKVMAKASASVNISVPHDFGFFKILPI